eukprot:jgi/Mesen1/2020/ME000148S01118
MKNMTSDVSGTVLQFSPWKSAVEIGFWELLARFKLEKYRLSEDPISITGFFSPSSHKQVPSYINLTTDSFQEDEDADPSTLSSHASEDSNLKAGALCCVPGLVHNTNTRETFVELDRPALLRSTTEKIWQSIMSGEAETDPSLLNAFVVISFADLKKWKFYYWCAFPGIVMPQAAMLSAPPQSAATLFGPLQAEDIIAAYSTWRRRGSQKEPLAKAATVAAGGEGSPLSVTAGAVEMPAGEGMVGNSKPTLGDKDETTASSSSAFLLRISDNHSTTAHPLSRWHHLQKQGGQVMLVFLDPCHLADNPGWPLRNLLALAAVRWNIRQLRVLCWRENRGRPDLARCPVLEITLPDLSAWTEGGRIPEAVGWEKNSKGVNGPRVADLAPALDPVRLATAAADLNLKLMRWRMLPSLDVPRLSSTRCLLLGAVVAIGRACAWQAWGVRHITLVDCGRVAMSNPLRQSLYTLEDCLRGGRPKAEAAAQHLSSIFPGMAGRHVVSRGVWEHLLPADAPMGRRMQATKMSRKGLDIVPGLPAQHAEGVQLAIPMPGHAVSASQEESVRRDCRQLEELIAKHDVVFLLTDTRESRWLPTLICSAHNKASLSIAVNAALGFDTFLVLRHGSTPCPSSSPPSIRATATGTAAPAQRLGCYFCNDVVAPLDSTTNRTLDQQCTVTRPGLAPMAAALAVELAIGLLHHPLGVSAPADVAAEVSSSTEMPLGILPHQVVTHYLSQKEDFCMSVFNDPDLLEHLMGLKELASAASSASVDWDDEDEDALL